MVLDIRKEAAEETAHTIVAAGGEARAEICDVLDIEDLRRCSAATESAFGSIDYLVNGAGGNRPEGSVKDEFCLPDSTDSFLDLSYEGMRKTFDLNFYGTVLPCQVFSRPMVSRQRGSIVNIGSISSHIPLTMVGPYSAAKAAVANFTQWLATHYSKVNVRVNAVAPGFVMTEQLRFLHVDAEGNYTPRARKVVNKTPLGRYGEPKELSGAVLWLLSDAASFVTGSVVTIDGGFSSFAV
jgi:NAD(P)-dependent dehydrogenase (short-subunit alcohol dehydrogenase family)